jgi:hypothetical protein
MVENGKATELLIQGSMKAIFERLDNNYGDCESADNLASIKIEMRTHHHMKCSTPVREKLNFDIVYHQP